MAVKKKKKTVKVEKPKKKTTKPEKLDRKTEMMKWLKSSKVALTARQICDKMNLHISYFGRVRDKVLSIEPTLKDKIKKQVKTQ